MTCVTGDFPLGEMFPQCQLEKAMMLWKNNVFIFIKTEVTKVFWDDTSEAISSKTKFSSNNRNNGKSYPWQHYY